MARLHEEIHSHAAGICTWGPTAGPTITLASTTHLEAILRAPKHNGGFEVSGFTVRHDLKRLHADPQLTNQNGRWRPRRPTDTSQTTLDTTQPQADAAPTVAPTPIPQLTTDDDSAPTDTDLHTIENLRDVKDAELALEFLVEERQRDHDRRRPGSRTNRIRRSRAVRIVLLIYLDRGVTTLTRDQIDRGAAILGTTPAEVGLALLYLEETARAVQRVAGGFRLAAPHVPPSWMHRGVARLRDAAPAPSHDDRRHAP